MITLTYINDKITVWNADDWLKIREEHRIVGALIGCLAHLPRQDSFLGLPMVLLPEEATLLLEKKVACLVSYPGLSRSPTSDVKKKFEEYRRAMYLEEVECLKEERKLQVTSMIDRIVEGKRKKLMGVGQGKKKKTSSDAENSGGSQMKDLGDEMEIDREALLKEELDKIKSVDENNALVQTFTASPWLTEKDSEPVQWNYPSTRSEKLRYKTFKDLWEKGHYLTPGQKFGADYLVYPGDPIKFHSQYLVICLDRDEALATTELVSLGRLGTSVRKTVVLASLSADGTSVLYQSLQWNVTL